ncbi:MAG: hypothetical protein WB586_02470 [Chthoniobacterales bacterium]
MNRQAVLITGSIALALLASCSSVSVAPYGVPVGTPDPNAGINAKLKAGYTVIEARPWNMRDVYHNGERIGTLVDDGDGGTKFQSADLNDYEVFL